MAFLDAIRQFLKKHPSLTLVMCGLWICFFAYGVNHSLVYVFQNLPERYNIVVRKYQFAIVVSTIAGIGVGILLIGLSAFVAVRRFANQRSPGRSAN